MRITDIKVHPIPMKISWLSEGLIANPMSVYPRYKEKRSSWFGPMTSAIIEIQTDEQINGLGMVGGGGGGGEEGGKDEDGEAGEHIGRPPGAGVCVRNGGV